MLRCKQLSLSLAVCEEVAPLGLPCSEATSSSSSSLVPNQVLLSHSSSFSLSASRTALNFSRRRVPTSEGSVGFLLKQTDSLSVEYSIGEVDICGWLCFLDKRMFFLSNFKSTHFHRQVICSMTSPCYAHAKFLPSKGNYEGYIPTTCTASSSLLSRQSSPVTHKISLGLGISAQLTYDGPQRSEEWFTLRREKLTTSAFSTALGFWKGNRRLDLWYQKVFAPDVDMMEASAKAAMEWGVFNEATAIEQYKSITGRDVSSLGFAVHTEATLDWLGASPDGLLGLYPDGGILEVKCPYNKGMPELALPWKIVPHYYMPQVQGQMEVMDREWVDLYCWTPKGSSLFRVYRDRAYWKLMHKILYEFWWGNVVPARQALFMGREVDARLYEPTPKHQLTSLVVSKSRKLAAEARLLCKDIGGHVEFFR